MMSGIGYERQMPWQALYELNSKFLIVWLIYK